MRLLVSIHDVTPALRGECEQLWAMARAQGVTPALLVVPNWHGTSPLERDHAFIDWLQARVADGAEIFLHGERHDEVGLPRSLGDAWRALGRTNREGEFLTLDRDRALERMTRGLALLQRLDLPPIGFIPPAWLSRQGCWEAARALDLRVGEDHRHVILVREAIWRPTPNLCWSGRTPMRAIISRQVVARQAAALKPGDTARVVFHPADLRHPATTAGTRDVLAALLARQARPMRYADLVREHATGVAA
jgi:predicted deacetylase